MIIEVCRYIYKCSFRAAFTMATSVKGNSAKKMKIDSTKTDTGFEKFINEIIEERNQTAESVMDFKFEKSRVRILSKSKEVPEWAKGIVYWTFRDQRIQDNWALLYAQKLALKNKIPLHICFCLKPKFMDATIRHYRFLLTSLKEAAAECKKLNIQFHMLVGDGELVLPPFIEKHKMGAVVIDFMPLKGPMSWAEQLKKTLPNEVPLCQVDAHNIVPCWIASDKLEYGARTIRNKINNKLSQYLTKFPPVMKHPYSGNLKADEIDWKSAENTLQVDRTMEPVTWLIPGYTGGMKMLYSFVSDRLKIFSSKRNDPVANALSNLSPYFHFGQLSVQRAVLVVKQLRSKYPESVDAFCEEAIIRRELADNFCFYNPNYDSIEGAYDWAKLTLNAHRKDKRTYLYSKEELDEAETHDDLWNSAQLQLIKDGKMHGFLRMYWAKKILEWTASPEEALSTALYLNDRYSMDGRDPNGFVGCMWSICGIHDQGWREREIFGKIRYMNYEGCKRKFDVQAFVARWGGKSHPYKKKK
ncbi:deoxyribodipyrimidine photo-lyase-like isoform X2 [Lycorma delicatula]|uniref:deoxyribodipyrimidine photo-lyase-like isoform X2 n=1 Tax=Lycorma delicatula TaxID=130591 RepID=UPI003F51827B